MNRLASPFSSQAVSPFAFSASLDHPADHMTIASHVSAGASLSTAGAERRARQVRPTPAGVALFGPIHYEPRYAYPLLVWLHGAGSSERELRQVMPNVSVRNYIGAAVRGGAAERGAKGCTWPQSAAAIDAALESVSECIESAQRHYHVHPQRVFLAGRGAGGTMALRLALSGSLELAGAASLGGGLPRGNCPLARVNEVRQLPLMLMTCRGSATYPPRAVAEDLRLLHTAGCKLAIREYLCGDELYTDMFADLNEWLMGRVCQPASATPA